MKFLQSVRQRGKLVLSIAVCWLSVHGVALAQMSQKKQESSGGNYVMAYGLVILVIAMGLMSVLRPSRRRDRAKPEVYDEIKIKTKE